MPVAPITDTTDEQWQSAMAATLGTAFAVSRAALPLMRPGGAIVAVSSVNGTLAAPGVPAYAAAKSGLEGLVRQLALEYGPRGIRVNAVAPGMIGPTGVPDAAAGYPLGRIGTPRRGSASRALPGGCHVCYRRGAAGRRRPFDRLPGRVPAARPACAMAELELAGFGEAMVLFEAESLATARSVDVHVAGAELNLCAAAARLGIATALCTRVGADPLGARVLASLDDLGVSTALAITDPDHPTGLFLKDVKPDGERRVHYYRRGSAASTMDISDADRLLAARPGLVAVSGITAALGPGPRAAVLSLAPRSGSPSIPTSGPPSARSTTQVDFARLVLPHVDILLLGLDEAELIFGSTDVFSVFPGEVILKAGPEGCLPPRRPSPLLRHRGRRPGRRRRRLRRRLPRRPPTRSNPRRRRPRRQRPRGRRRRRTRRHHRPTRPGLRPRPPTLTLGEWRSAESWRE